jgi:hypothetical protein
MTTLSSAPSLSTTDHGPLDEALTQRPGVSRRVAVGVTGLIAATMPTAWTVNIARMLVVGEQPDHQFHQATGQGLLLTALWLGAVLPLMRSGWTGRRPSTATGLLHLVFVLAGVALAVAAPGGGAPVLMGIVAVTGGGLWLALPRRPRLRAAVSVDPLLAPAALLSAAVFAPYAVSQLALQNAATGLHAENPHFWDMAWLTVVLSVTALLAAALPTARSLMWWLAAGATVIGVAGLAFGEGVTWSGIVLGVGLLSTGAALVRRRLDRSH